MSTCVKNLYGYDLVKKCNKCANVSLKSNFYEDSIKKMVIYQSVDFVLRSIITLIEIGYQTIEKRMLRKIEQKQISIKKREKRTFFCLN